MAIDKNIRFRFAQESDIPEIIGLLKSGLGENLIPKTEVYWRWKHIENPFGPSMTLLALQDNNIVGIRTFMRWRWKFGKEFLEAVRGVDTVIKQEYQGQGVFGELTQYLFEHCYKIGFHFLFSTPNRKSKMGYKRLGWDLVGNLPISLKLIKPVSVIGNLILNDKQRKIDLQGKESIETYLDHPDFASLLSSNDVLYFHNITTAHNVETLRWRYARVPVANYFAFGVEIAGALKGVCFYRFKEMRAGRELRITDIFIENWKYVESLKSKLEEIIEIHDIDYVTSGCFGRLNILAGGLIIKRRRIGPAVMGRNILLPDLKRFKKFSDWKPSLGDLELF